MIEIEKGRVRLTKDYYIVEDTRKYFEIKLENGVIAGTKAETEEEALERIKKTLEEKIAI